MNNEAITLPSYAQTALDILEQAGFEAYCVGGFVRDSLMGRPQGDIDIASSATWEKAQGLFEAAGFKTFETGTKHGTITVLVESMPLEITTYRSEGSYSDRRHPDSVHFVDSIVEDLQRRDFTINAIAYHPERGLFDPFDGQLDIERGIIRTVGQAEKRFTEDALRILRALRFASQLGFSIEDRCLEAMLEHKGLLHFVAVERIRHELDAFVCGKDIRKALVSCVDILGEVIPQLLPMKGFDQKTPYHIFDVLEHSALCMQNTRPSLLVRWAAFFHDMGKPGAFFTDKAGIGHFYGHAEISTEIALDTMERLRFPHALCHDIALLVRYHDVVFPATPKSVKRMLQKLEGRTGLFFALTELKRADASAQAPQCANRVELARELDEVLVSILEKREAFSLADLAINGHDLLARGIAPGPLVGSLLERALDALIDEQVANEKPALLDYLGL